MRGDKDSPLIDRDITVTLIVMLIGLVSLLAFCSCRTVDQIARTPEDVWISLWLIVEAFIFDVADLVKLVL